MPEASPTLAPAAGWSSFKISGALLRAVARQLLFRAARSLRIISDPTASKVNFTLLLWEIENALTKLVIYAAVMCEAFHRASSYH
jgi:hypothetical protein